MKIQKMDLLVALYVFCILVAETMGGKTFPLLTLGSFKLNASVAIFVLPLIFTINDVVTEVYGKQRARSIIRSGLIMIVFLIGFTLLATALPPSGRFAGSEQAYDLIFHQSTRIAVASLIAFSAAEFLDVYVFSRLRERLGKGRLWLRNNASNFLSQFVDTTLFMTLAFYATNQGFGENFQFLWSLILPYWLLKCSMSVIETPLVYVGVAWLKRDGAKHGS